MTSYAAAVACFGLALSVHAESNDKNQKPAKVPPVGAVTENQQSRVVVNLGAEHGVSEGDHMLLYEAHNVQLGGDATVEEVVLAVGSVASVSPRFCLVRLGTNEQVPAGALARVTDQPLTARRVNPPRPGGTWSVAGAVRPFLGVGTLGFGTITSLSLTYRFEFDLTLQLWVEPLAGTFARGGQVGVVNANLFAAYERSLVAVGIGLGQSTIADASTLARSGLSLAQLGRLGSEDGLHVEVRNQFVLFSNALNYGSTIGRLSIPLAQSLWLQFHAGGGQGFAFGELAMRILIMGTGHHGSLFMTPSLGVASVWTYQSASCDPISTTSVCQQSVAYTGPMVGLAAEWRP